jgi:hypothetical protein
VERNMMSLKKKFYIILLLTFFSTQTTIAEIRTLNPPSMADDKTSLLAAEKILEDKFKSVFTAWDDLVYKPLKELKDPQMSNSLAKFLDISNRIASYELEVSKDFTTLLSKQLTGFNSIPIDKIQQFKTTPNNINTHDKPIDVGQIISMFYKFGVYPLDDNTMYNQASRYPSSMKKYLSYLPNVYNTMVVVLRKSIITKMRIDSCDSYFNKDKKNEACKVITEELYNEIKNRFSDIDRVRASLKESPYSTDRYKAKLNAFLTFINHNYIQGQSAEKSSDFKSKVLDDLPYLELGIDLMKDFFSKVVSMNLEQNGVFNDVDSISLNDLLKQPGNIEEYKSGVYSYFDYLSMAVNSRDRMMPAEPLVANTNDPKTEIGISEEEVIYNGSLMPLNLFLTDYYDQYKKITDNRKMLQPKFVDNKDLFLKKSLASVTLLNYPFSSFYELMSYRVLSTVPSDWRFDPNNNWYNDAKLMKGIAIEKEKLYELFEIKVAYERQNIVIQRLLATLAINVLVDAVNESDKTIRSMNNVLKQNYMQLVNFKGPSTTGALQSAQDGNVKQIRSQYTGKSDSDEFKKGMKDKMKNK